MNNGVLSYIIDKPFENGLTVFISGFLFALSVYHLMLYFQNKNKSYLLYGVYTALNFLYISMQAKHFFIAIGLQAFRPLYNEYNVALQWLFNTFYFLFVIHFIALKKQKPDFYRWLQYIIIFYFSLLIALILYVSISGNHPVLIYSYSYFFLPTVTPLAIYTMYVLYRMKTVLKYYILIGSFVYLTLSLTAFYFAFFGNSHIHFFYLALFIENIFFALGLGAQRRLYQEEKMRMQRIVIEKHRENMALQQKIKEKTNARIRQKKEEIAGLIREKNREEKNKLEAEYRNKTMELRLRALQTQMNPHFLFNVLNSIKHYIVTNQKEDASVYLGKLSKLIRTILDNSQKPEIYLREELEIMQLYIEVENLRLSEPVHLTIKAGEKVKNIKILPLILQPFIENAIWHGLVLKKGEKKITIYIEKEGEKLHIIIEDNGIGREQAALIQAKKKTEKESLGIALTKERLATYYKSETPQIYFEDLYDNERATGTRVHIITSLSKEPAHV